MSEGNDYMIAAFTDANTNETIQEKDDNFAPFKWTIKNLIGFDREHRWSFSSPFFTVDPSEEESWIMEMFFCREIKNPFLIIRSEENFAVKVIVVTAILGSPKNVQKKKAIFHEDQHSHIMRFNKDVSADCDFFASTLHEEYIDHDLITILVELSDETLSAPVASDLLQLSRDMTCVLGESKFSDLNLTAEGRDIKVHKNILSARSEVFEKMFQHQVEETANNRVNITDMTFQTLEHFVKYLYAGIVEGLTVELAMNLFVASDKYAVSALHDTCGRFLRMNISVENCVEILVLADRHGNASVKRAALGFYIENGKQICGAPNWDEQLKTEPLLLCELLKCLIMK